ncbi:MAG: M20/M25/M40 family metallo-hydrolase [Candidatus Rokubacteria bacterium]|nr:M20/M25/M40 family metallo-hydrolase [Candidatus Rokubacteria bacterium]
MSLRDLRLFLGGALNIGAARVLNAARPARPVTPLSLEGYLGLAAPEPLDTVRLLEGRSNRDRLATLLRLLEARGIPHRRLPYRSLEGSGENLVLEAGTDGRVLLLAGHHDAVPGSPGANDNAAAVAILLRLLERLLDDPPRRFRVRVVIFGDEEKGFLGSRAYVRAAPLDDLLGVVSLELCGIGDGLALWDVEPEAGSRLARAFAATAEALGYRRDEGYHLVGRIPLFGSDHRPFAARGIPAYGLTVIPNAAREALRSFIFRPLRPALLLPARRPPPFRTYHTPLDRADTLEPAALGRVGALLEALCRELDTGA